MIDNINIFCCKLSITKHFYKIENSTYKHKIKLCLKIRYICRYASLYFCCAIEQDDNELLTLEVIHRYVELLDKYFGSVSITLIIRMHKLLWIISTCKTCRVKVPRIFIPSINFILTLIVNTLIFISTLYTWRFTGDKQGTNVHENFQTFLCSLLHNTLLKFWELNKNVLIWLPTWSRNIYFLKYLPFWVCVTFWSRFLKLT